LPGLTREGAQSVADQTAVSSQSRLPPLAVRLAAKFVNSFCARIDKAAQEPQVPLAGLLFGVTGESLVVMQSFRSLDVHEAGPVEGEQLAKAFERALGESQTDPEVSALDLVGWFSLRPSAGLHASDIEFHNAHFRRPKDLALILRSQADGDVLLEFYSRAKTPRLSPEEHRWGALRLSTDVPVLGPIEVTMRAAVAEDELMSLDSLDRALEGEHRKSRGGMKGGLKILRAGQGGILRERQLAVDAAVPVYEANGGKASRIPALLISSTPRLWLVLSVIFVAVFAIFGAATFAFFLLHGLRAETARPGSLRAVVPDTSLGLRAEAQHDRVLLSWNRRNPAVRSAKSATLHIEDGAQRRDVHLDAAQIDNAAVLYDAKSDDVTFRLEVRSTQGSAVVESVRVLDAAPRTPLDLSTVGNAPIPGPEPAPSQLTEQRDSNPAPETKTAAALIAPAPVPLPNAALLPTLPSPNGALMAALEAAVSKAWEHHVELASAAVSNRTARAQATASTLKKSPPPVSNAISTHSELRSKVGTEEPSLIKQQAENSQTAPAVRNVPVTPPPAPVQGPVETQGTSVPQADFKPPRPIRQVVPDTSPIPPTVLASSPQVKVMVQIDKQGNVTDAQIVAGETNVSEVLANAALRAAMYWTFEPGTLGGRSVATSHTIVFQFRPQQ
jgi:TonB family protein